MKNFIVMMFVTSLSAGAALSQSAQPQCTKDSKASCLGLPEKPEAVQDAKNNALNVYKEPLKICSLKPKTGWHRDGYCRTDKRDRGVHVVCAEMSGAFLRYTKAQGNDLSTPNLRFGFAGLKAGDRWCLCASRFEQARKAGHAPKVLLDASDEKTLKFTSMPALEKHALKRSATQKRPPK